MYIQDYRSRFDLGQVPFAIKKGWNKANPGKDIDHIQAECHSANTRNTCAVGIIFFCVLATSKSFTDSANLSHSPLVLILMSLPAPILAWFCVNYIVASREQMDMGRFIKEYKALKILLIDEWRYQDEADCLGLHATESYEDISSFVRIKLRAEMVKINAIARNPESSVFNSDYVRLMDKYGKAIDILEKFSLDLGPRPKEVLSEAKTA